MTTPDENKLPEEPIGEDGCLAAKAPEPPPWRRDRGAAVAVMAAVTMSMGGWDAPPVSQFNPGYQPWRDGTPWGGKRDRRKR